MNMDSQFDYLFDAARWAPSADNVQPWQLRLNGDELTVGYDAARVAGVTHPPQDPATLLAMGALLENLLQAGAATGFGLERLDPSDDEYFRLRVSPATSAAAGRPDHPLFLRHTNRRPFRTDPLPAGVAESISGESEGAARALVFTDSSGRGRIAHLVKQASAIRFQTRESSESLGRSLRFTPREVESGDGLDVSTLHLPPGGNALVRLTTNWRVMQPLNRLGVYKALAAMESKPIANAPAIVAVIGSTGLRGALDAGQLMERIWIDLNRYELGVQPFYVVSDQLFRRERSELPEGLERHGDAMAQEAETVFGLAGQKLYMLFRVGHPTGAPIKSRRLPLSTIVKVA